jgi:hypothetical protein
MVSLIVFLLLSALCVWVSLLNWWVVIAYVLWRRRSGSWLPFIGGLFGAGALLFGPFSELSSWWWVPLFLDWGCLPGFTFTLLWLGMKKLRE